MKVCSVCDRCFDDTEVYCSEAGHPPLHETRKGGIEMVDGYRIDALLSAGLQGDAYQAHHVASGRSCIIRMVSADEGCRENFLADAKLAAAMFHAHLADIYESGTMQSGGCYVVAEGPAGRSLRDHMVNVGVSSLLTAIQVARQAAEALYALHQKNLTHGALCPENIILTRDADDRLSVRVQNPDFGRAAQNAIVSNKFFIDSAVNSLRYFAPEQCLGENGGPKADIYSLGIVLYEMLAGSPPFEASSAAALIEKHKSQRPPEIRIDNFDLRMLVAHSLMESLSKRPERRQSSANAFARQMRHIEQLATHVSTPPPVVASAAPNRPSASAPAIRRVVVADPAVERMDADLVGVENEIYRDVDLMPEMVLEMEWSPSVSSVIIDETEGTLEVGGTISNEPAMDREVQVLPAEPGPESLDEITTPTKAFEAEEASPSRLKRHRRKLHSLIAPLVVNVPVQAAVENSPAAEETSREQHQLSDSTDFEVGIDVQAAAKPSSKPVKIEWEQPDDDIPSITDVAAVLASEGVAPLPDPQPEKVPVPAVEVTALAKVPASPKVRISPKVELTKRPRRTVEAAPLKATLAVSRAQAARSTAIKALPKASRESTFFPTLLGNAGVSDLYVPEASGEIFSTYNAASAVSFSMPKRGLLVGCGALVLISLFLFGNGTLGRFASMEPSGDSVAAKSISTAAALSEAPPVAYPAAQIQETIASESPTVASRSTAVRPPHIGVKEPAAPRVGARRNDDRPNDRKPTQKPATPTTEEAREKKPTAAPGNVVSDKTSRQKPVKVAGATRPRIVKESNR